MLVSCIQKSLDEKWRLVVLLFASLQYTKDVVVKHDNGGTKIILQMDRTFPNMRGT